jgi:hypothetical protein
LQLTSIRRFEARPAKTSPTKDTRYLQRVGSRWYARVPVPNKLRSDLGPYLRKSLDTANLTGARKLLWDVVPLLRAKIAKHEAKGRPEGLSEAELSYAAFRAKPAEVGHGAGQILRLSM